jgi:guanine deaminase
MAYAYDNALCLDQRVTAAELFTLATLGGARALGLDAVIGALTPGREADVVALTLPTPIESAEDALAQVAFADGVKVALSLVRGRRLTPDVRSART